MSYSEHSSDEELLASDGDDEDDESDQRTLLITHTLEYKLLDETTMASRVEKDSIYGAALVVPQIAQSLSWPVVTSGLALRIYLFLILNFILQAFFTYSLYVEQYIMDRFSGQPNLCDFGARMWSCTSGAGCSGPGGTDITPVRLYSWQLWSLRTYMKDSLLTVFPDMQSEINDKIDPGEYGIESYWCRVCCCFVFVIAIMEELYHIARLIKLLWMIPTRSEMWVVFDGDLNKDAPAPELNDMEFRIAGMSRLWKIINVMLVVLPRIALWKCLAEAGVLFLMETAGISDMIINAVALGFIFNIDNLIFDAFCARATRHIMGDLKDYRRDSHHKECVTQQDILNKAAMSKYTCWNIVYRLLPLRLVTTLVLTLLLIFHYYHRHCMWTEDGAWISKTVFLPPFGEFHMVMHAITPDWMWPPSGVEEKVSWAMPEK